MNKSKNDYLILFAPKFLELGVDVANKLTKINSNSRILAICIGGTRVFDYVSKNIDQKNLIDVVDLDFFIEEYIRSGIKIDYEYLKTFEKKFGDDFIGKLIVSDRKIGQSFVSGGKVRPGIIKDLSKNSPNQVPILYISALLKKYNFYFDKYKFKTVFIYAVAASPALIAYYFSNYYKSSFRTLKHTRIDSYFHLDNNPYGALNEIKKKFNSDNQISDDAKKKAKLFLEDYRKKPILPEYSAFNRKKKNLIFKKLIDYIIYSIVFFLNYFIPKNYRINLSVERLRHRGFNFHVALSRYFSKNIFFEDLPQNKFVYYPLHVDPEASTMVLSPYHTNQIAIIENLAKSLPSDLVLVVKEHIPMIGLRPKGFYKKIKSFPRVFLVDPNIDQFNLIKKSELIVSITGTSPFEGLLLRKKSIILSNLPPFTIFNKGIIVETDISKFNDAFRKLNKIEYLDDASLIKYIALIIQNSKNFKSSLIWGDYRSHSKIEKNSIVNFISNGIS